jgi:hypothetical protein
MKEMVKPNFKMAEGMFILGFGIFHLFVPFLFPPNLLTAFIPIYSLLWGLNLADFVIPGCIAVASLSVAFKYTRNRFLMATLMFMYLCGAVFHMLYVFGFIPSLLKVTNNSTLISGIFIDVFTTAIIYDYHRL